MENFIILGQLFTGEKYVAEKERNKKNNPKNSGHFVPQQRLRAAHALRSDQYNIKVRLSILNVALQGLPKKSGRVKY